MAIMEYLVQWSYSDQPFTIGFIGAKTFPFETSYKKGLNHKTS